MRESEVTQQGKARELVHKECRELVMVCKKCQKIRIV